VLRSVTMANERKVELDENEAWEFYSFLLQKQRELTDKLAVAIKKRDRTLIHQLIANSREISKKLDHVDEFLDQFE